MCHGKPAVFGEDGEKGIVIRADGGAEVVAVADVGLDAIYVHDAHAAEPHVAFALSRVTHASHGATPLGVLRSIKVPSYDQQLSDQLSTAVANSGAGDLQTLLGSVDTWQV